MTKSLLTFCLAGFIQCAFSQLPLHADELRKSLNPYQALVPHYFQYDFSLQASATREVTIVPVEEQFDYFNTAAGAWQPAFRFNYEYLNDAKLQVMNEFNYLPSTISWLNTKRVTYSYDAYGFQSSATEEVYNPSDGGLMLQLLYALNHSSNGNLLMEQISYWNAVEESWSPDHKHDYAYNTNGYEQSVVHADWTDSSFQWSPYQEYTSSYDGNHQLILYLGKTWDAGLQQWLNEIKDTISYNTLQQLHQTETQTWSAAGNKWTPYYRTTYEHDEYGNLQKMTGSFWNVDAAAFAYSNQYLFIFENSRLSETIYQLWNENMQVWANFNQTKYSYDTSGYLTGKTISNWINNEWNESYRYLFNNDMNGMVLQSTGQSWSNVDSQWHDIERYTASWLTFTSATSLPVTDYSILIFPNPAGDLINFRDLQPGKQYEVKIMDTEGSIRQESVISCMQPMETAALPEGIYLLYIKENGRNEVAACKLVITR